MPNDNSPWYAEGLRFECRRCSSCCGGFPGFVWVSDKEADAIARRLGIEREEFLRGYCKRAGRRWTLQEVENFNCVMLEGGGCRIYDVRPVQCLTFPFWNQNLRTRRAWDAAAQSCRGMNEGELRALDEIERLRDMRE